MHEDDDRTHAGDAPGQLRGRVETPLPPAHLQARVMESLTARGLIAAVPTGGRMSRTSRAIFAAAAVLLFVAGLFAGRQTLGGAAAASANTDPRYMLLLYSDERVIAGEQGVEHDRVTEYGRWARSLAEGGRYVTGEELAKSGTLLTAPASQPIAESDSLTAASWRPVGFFVVSARSDADALAIARECPHLKYSGRVLVRRIIPT
jgi:hypothetical protein